MPEDPRRGKRYLTIFVHPQDIRGPLCTSYRCLETCQRAGQCLLAARHAAHLGRACSGFLWQIQRSKFRLSKKYMQQTL